MKLLAIITVLVAAPAQAHYDAYNPYHSHAPQQNWGGQLYAPKPRTQFYFGPNGEMGTQLNQPNGNSQSFYTDRNGRSTSCITTGNVTSCM